MYEMNEIPPAPIKTQENTNETVDIAKIAEEIQERNRVKQIQEAKRKLWCDVYLAILSSDNSNINASASYSADSAVREFEERFNK
jgi:hypothetical protein